MVKKNILITGSNGQLGRTLKEISANYNYNYFFKEKKNLNISNFSIINSFLKKNDINIIINCAAFTDVDKSEINKDLANEVNNLAVDNIAKLCFELEIKLIHISTDYVFDSLGKTPLNELNHPNPKNYYGMTKLNGEKKILSYNLNNSVIIRTSWLYSKFENNFVSKILLKLKNENQIIVVDNEISSPTSALDLSKTIMEIIPRLSNNKTEIYHYSNQGFCSRFQFANKINELIKGDCIILPKKQNINKSIRPRFSALDSSKIIKNFKLEINSWDSSLRLFLTENHIKYSNEI
tara:strand:+ start:559 stop:1437 length:879 start_codon:yes stop_codon:yes gene_type:complete